MITRRRRPGPAGDQGSVTIWMLLLAPVLFVFAGLVLDGGRVITARQEAANLAEQAARQAVDQLDTTAFRATGSQSPVAQANACQHLPPHVISCTATLTGSGVQVRLRLQTRTAVLAGLGITQITVTGTGAARPAVGDRTEATR